MGKLIYTFIVVTLAAIFFVPISQFPDTKGPYDVGQIKYHWTDLNRKELNTNDLKHPYREIMAYVFYPTQKNNNSTHMLYNSDGAKSVMDNLARKTKLPSWLFSGIRFMKTHSQWNAPLAQGSTHFPVIIFSHGGGPMIQHYTWLLEELTSYGFVVVGINHPYVANTVRFSDNRVVESIMTKKTTLFKNRKHYEKWRLEQIETNAQDVSFIIDKIKNLAVQGDEFWKNIKTNLIGVFGHSFGGAVALRATRNDQRIQCGINIDERLSDDDINKPFKTPFLFLLAEKSHQWFKKKNLDNVMRLAKTDKTNMYTVMFTDITHGLFADYPFYYKTTLFMLLTSYLINPNLGVSVNKAIDVLVNQIQPYIVEFFGKHLKDKQSKLLPGQKGNIVIKLK